MSHRLSNTTLTRKDRLHQLKEREQGWFDLRFVKAMEPAHRSACIDLLDVSPSLLRQDLFALARTGFRKGGYFVEFGAADGVRRSNTWLLEKRFGWKGILAEPGPDWHAALKANRGCAIDTRCVWHESGQRVPFTGLTASDTDDPQPDAACEVETVSLDDLLETHGAPPVIDYLSVDTEGSEYEILAALDFDRWSFRVLTVEHNFARQREDIHTLLRGKGYVRVLEDVSRFDDWYVPAG